MGNTKNTGYLQNIVQYDASNNITLPANLTVTGTITGYATTSYVGTQLAGYVPTTRTISINGTSLDLSANRSFTINSMVYPGAGIAVSTGSAWGTSLTDNSGNWNTAFGWGNHAGLYSLLNHTHTFASLTSKPTTLVGYGITDAATSAQGTSADTAYGWGNHASAGYATTTYVGTQIANLVASAPATLDTLNELAAALGNDPSFATTVSTSIGTKVPQARTITINGTSYDLTANRSWTINSMVYPSAGIALSTGTAWGTSITDNSANWNTAYGWGNHASAGYAASSHTHSIANVTGLQTALDGKQASGSYAAATHSHIISDVTGLQTALDGKQASLGFTPYNSTNPSGYISSYTEIDTLATVTGRGNTTTDRINVRGIGNQSGGNILMGNIGVNTNKWSYLTGTHYNTSTQPQGVSIIGLYSDLNNNSIIIGGSIYEANPATEIQFWTHNATSHATGGTLKMTLNSAGNLIITGTVSASNFSGSHSGASSGTNTGDQTNISGNAATATNVAYSGLTGTVPTWNQNTTGTAAYATQWGTSAGYANFSSTAISASVGWLFGTTGNGTYAPVSLASVATLLSLGSLAYSSATIPTNNNQLTNGAGYITGVTNISGTAGSTPILTASGGLTTQYGNGTIGYSYAITTGTAGLFSTSDNSNAIITINRHPDNYYSQLGFNSSGGLFYRSFSATAINTSQGWQTIWTSSSLTNLNQLTNGPGYITGINSSAVTTALGYTPLSSSGDVTIGGYLTVNGSGTSSSIYMKDSDEGNREIHCNSNRIGFLTQAGSWGAWCDDSGNWNAANFSGSSSGTNTGDQTSVSGNAGTVTNGVYTTGDQTIGGIKTFGKRTYFGSSSGWDDGSLSGENVNITNLHFQGHADFWIGAGNGTWYTTATAGDHDLIINTMHGQSSYNRGISFTASLSGTSGYKLGKWYSGTSAATSYLSISGGLVVGGTTTLTSIKGAAQTVPNTYGAYLHLGDWAVARTAAGAVLVNTAYRADYATDLFDMNISRFTNNSGYITSSGILITIQDTAPTGVVGKLWWESDTGKLKVYYGSAWVDASPIPDVSLYYSKAGGTITGDVSIGQTLNVVGNTLVQGTISAFGDIIAYSSSDARLKDNITVIESPLEKLSKINGVSFNWNDKQSAYEVGKKDIGVIAQEVEEVLPELVTTRDNGYKAVRYEKIVALLIEAVKEQQTQINNLTDKLNNL